MLRFFVFTAIAFNLIACIPDAIQLAFTYDLLDRTMLTCRMAIHVMLAAAVFALYEK